MEVLGIALANLSATEIREKMSAYLDEPEFHRIATVNPEFLMLARRDMRFRRALHEADLRVADGAGIGWAFSFLGEKLKARLPGADLMLEILDQAAEKNLGVYVAARKYGLSSYEEIRKALVRKYPTLRVEGQDFDVFHSGWPESGCQVALCNFGAPDQELFLAALRSHPGSLRLAMGVGGSLDYLTGRAWRAPKFLRKIGLEWLWRLILQPRRLRRAWQAVAVFPYTVWKEKKSRKAGKGRAGGPFTEQK